MQQPLREVMYTKYVPVSRVLAYFRWGFRGLGLRSAMVSGLGVKGGGVRF